MNDIPVGDARDITRELSTRLLTLFDIFRSAYPSKLKYVFKPENHLNITFFSGRTPDKKVVDSNIGFPV